MLKKITNIIILLLSVLSLSGCAMMENNLNSLKGSLIGNGFDVKYYDNFGNNYLSVKGNRVDIDSIIVKTKSVNKDGSIITNYELSSAIDITIDGHQLISCGNSALFISKNLKPLKDFEIPKEINFNTESEAITYVSKNINNIRNLMGKSTIVIICSENGSPINVFEGDSVNFKIPDDLPKFTKLSIDGEPLYLHRVKYFIIDTALIEQE